VLGGGISGRRTNSFKISIGALKESAYAEYLCIDGWVILKYTSQRAGIGLNSVVSERGLMKRVCGQGKDSFGFVMGRELHGYLSERRAFKGVFLSHKL
jgi:hypothetical protein